MGRSITPKYRIITWESVNGRTGKYMMAWDCKRNGRPTAANLARFVESLQASYLLGGVNEHISKLYGCIPNVFKALIETNDGYGYIPETMAQYYAHAFQVI